MSIPSHAVLAVSLLGMALVSCTPARRSADTEGTPASRALVTTPVIVSAEQWGSRPDAIPDSRKQVPVRITIHHAGVFWKVGSDPYTKIRNLQTWGKRDKHWPDVPYHYLVAPDGRIFEGRDWHYEGETNTEYDTNGHLLVQLWGDFDKQKVTQAQLQSAIDLVAWLCARLSISPSTIRGHRDWSRQTSCPGEDLYRYLQNGEFVRRVREKLR